MIWLLSKIISFLTLDQDELELTPAVTLCFAGLDVTFAAGTIWVLNALLKSREMEGRDMARTRTEDSSGSILKSAPAATHTSAAAALWPLHRGCVCSVIGRWWIVATTSTTFFKVIIRNYYMTSTLMQSNCTRFKPTIVDTCRDLLSTFVMRDNFIHRYLSSIFIPAVEESK